MRNRIFGFIGVLWGGLSFVHHFTGQTHVAHNAAYTAGQNVSFIFSILLFGVGLYYLMFG
ncbi:MAG: hypothetical protein JO316_01430 [Abitibacteriaceae bacterium]|nr:hypothetical protein [Abditibacteriaceae bacterium]